MTLLLAPAAVGLRRALDAHFDPDTGSPYWLDRERELGLDARRDVHDVADLAVFGPFDRAHWTDRPLADFVPRGLWAERRSLVLAESGGTTGRPVRCVFTRDEFELAFGAPFAAASAARGFPRGGEWLFVGPTGPHVIGQAARLLANMHGALQPYAVDLDPRWARAQAEGSLGARLYTRHVLDQALDILERERVTVLFVTPPLALALGDELDPALRQRVAGIHLGGMAVTPDARRRVEQAFPRAVVLPGYGNSQFGLMIEAVAPDADGRHCDYFPLPGRLVVRIAPEDVDQVHLNRSVDFGERGRVVLSRLDTSFLIPNLVERDSAVRIAAPAAVRSLGLAEEGVRDPFPVVVEQATQGLY